MPRLGLILLALTLLFGAGWAQNRPDPELIEEQISAFEELLSVREAELEGLESQLSTTNTELDAQLQERDRISADIVALGEQQETIREQVRNLQRQQRAADVRVGRLERQAQALRQRLQDLILNLHKRRGGSGVGVLSQAETLFELRVKNYYLSRLTAQDTALLDTFERTTTSLNRARRERSRQVQALASRERDLARNGQALQAAQADLETVIANLSESRAGQLAQRETLLQEQGSIETDLTGARTLLAAELERRQREAEQAAQRAAENAAASADDTFSEEAEQLRRLIDNLNNPEPQTEQDYALPFSDPVIVRPYGEGGATDILLRAPQPGSAVRAVKSGVVYRTSLITANSGYTVAIQHGPNLISAYTNLQAPVVQEGDEVQQGDILGYLGGGIVAPDILQFRLGRPQGLDIIYQDPAPLLGLGTG